MIKIVLPGEPISKDRPRFSKHGTYDLQAKLKYACKFQIISQLYNRRDCPLHKDIPIDIEMKFYFSIPKGKESLFEWGLLDHVSKPDYDNCEKWVLDCLSKIVYSDDKQVNVAQALKEYSHEPRTEIYIMIKSQTVPDQVKEVLSLVPPSQICEISDYLSAISDWCSKNENPFHGETSMLDYNEVVMLICDFAEKHADTLKKINKKFPGLAKVLNNRLKEK